MSGPGRRTDEVEFEEGLLRDEVWNVDKDGNKAVDNFKSNSTGVVLSSSDCFTTTIWVGEERTCTIPHKNDLYCSLVDPTAPSWLIIIDRSFAKCPRDAAR